MSNYLFGFRPKYEERFFWSFKEILDPTSSKEEFNLSNADILTIALAMPNYSSPLIENNNWKEANVSKLLDLIVKRFHSFICVETISSEFSIEKRNNFIAKLLAVVEMTSPRYLKLLELYTSQANNLLAPVKTESNSKNRFNDTPQNNGTYEEDPFTTNISFLDSISKTDVDTIMGRLREIEGNYNNVLLNWSNEFQSLFIEEDNI